MADDHEDYETGAAPAAHGPSHELDGDDEFSIAGLSGETAELAAHKILPAIHHVKFTAVEARAAINNIFGADGKADVDINLDTHKLINVVDPVTDQGGDTKKARNDAISTHAGLATVHQDAPGLIETHRLVAGAHHARYTDAEVRAAFSPIVIGAAQFLPEHDTNDWSFSNNYLMNRSSLTLQYFYAGIRFPPGVTITKITMYGYRDDADSSILCYFRRGDLVGSYVNMGFISADWTTGWSSSYDNTINYSVIDNTQFSYFMLIALNPNNSVWDVRFSAIIIEFTG